MDTPGHGPQCAGNCAPQISLGLCHTTSFDCSYSSLRREAETRTIRGVSSCMRPVWRDVDAYASPPRLEIPVTFFVTRLLRTNRERGHGTRPWVRESTLGSTSSAVHMQKRRGAQVRGEACITEVRVRERSDLGSPFWKWWLTRGILSIAKTWMQWISLNSATGFTRILPPDSHESCHPCDAPPVTLPHDTKTRC